MKIFIIAVLVIILLAGVNPVVAAEISNETIQSFIRSYIDTYKAYVELSLEEFREYKDLEGHYVFFLYKNYPFHVRTTVSSESIGFEFLPSNSFSCDEIYRNKSVSDLTKGAIGETGAVGMRIKNTFIKDKYGAKFFYEIRVVPIDWLQNPGDVAFYDFNEDYHTVQTIQYQKNIIAGFKAGILFLISGIHLLVLDWAGRRYSKQKPLFKKYLEGSWPWLTVMFGLSYLAAHFNITSIIFALPFFVVSCYLIYKYSRGSKGGE